MKLRVLSFSRNSLSFAVSIAALLAAPSSFAATRFWSGNGTAQGGAGTWNTTSARWGSAAAGPYTLTWNNAANDTAEFNSKTGTITLATDVTVGRINAKTGSSGNTLAEGAGLHTITLGSTNTIINNAGSATATRSLAVNARLVGSNNLQIVGPTTTAGGSVTLGRSNTYTGTTSVNNTTLAIGAAGQLNSGDYSAAISLGTVNSFFAYNSGLNQTLGGIISGLGSLSKGSSSGILTITGINTYSGATNVTSGTLVIAADGSINNSSGIVVNGGSAKLLQSSSTAISPTVTLTNGTLTGSGAVNAVNVGNATGGIISNNDGIADTALTIGALTFNGAATINTFGNVAASIVTTSLVTDAAGEVTINPSAASWTSGSTYNLISYGGGSIGGAGFGQFVLGTISGKAARQTGTLIDTGSAIAVQIGGSTDSPYWVGDTNGQWDTTTNNNWKLLSAGTYTNFIEPDTVLFNDNASGTGTIAVNIDAADVLTSSTTFDNSAKNYVLNSSGGLGISTEIFDKNGTGSVTLGTASVTAGSIAINNGTISQTGGVTTVGTLQIGGSAGAPGATAALQLTGGAFTATIFDMLSSGDNITSNLLFGGTAEITLPAFPTNAKGVDAAATITFDSTTGFLSPAAASASYMPAGTFEHAYLTANGAIINVPSAKNITIGQVLEDAVSPSAMGSLTKDGSGILTLAAANTFTGATTINDGILQLSDLSALGGTSGITMAGGQLRPTISNVSLSAPIDTSGSVTIGAPTNNIGNQAFNRFILNGAITGTGNVTFDSSLNTNVIQTVQLNAACTYSGTTLLTTSGGTASQIVVRLGVADALPTTTELTIDGQNGTGSGRYAEVNLNGFNQTLAGLSNIARTSRVQRVINSDVSAACTLTIDNINNFSYSASLGSGANGSVGPITTPGSTNGNNFGLTKSGLGIFTLTGNNTFYGPTKITGGILSLGNELALQGSPLDTQNSIVADADNGLETTVISLTFGGLTGNKNLESMFNTSTGGYLDVTSLTLKPGTGASHIYSGIIADGAEGMTLTKSGLGIQTLAGANTYTGATTVAAGTLALVGGSQTSAITVNSGASLGFTLDSATTSTADVIFEAGSSVAITGGPVSAATYTLMTTTATITGIPVLSPHIPGFVLQVEGANTLKLVPVAPGSYAAWQSANDTTEAAHLDHDQDGVANGVEYFLGGSNVTTGYTALPSVTNAAGTLSVTWTKDATYTGVYGTGFVVETSSTLDGPWVTEIAEPNVGFTVSFPSANEVKYTFPSPFGTKNFARLKVTP
jgi:autotransporter-associated beta strand protein